MDKRRSVPSHASICFMAYLFHSYVRGGDALRHRRELASGVQALDSWLAAADNLLSRQPRANTGDIQAYIDQLLQLNSEIEHHEELFKTISRFVTSLFILMI